MPRKPPVAPPEVITRQLAPQADEVERESHLHRPVPQLDTFPPAFDISYVWFTPEKADEWLKTAMNVEGFRQRPLSLSQVRRWKNLISTKRFVHFLPNQAICTDPDGVLINGQHRLTGVAGSPDGTEVGFMVIRNVPRWMFAFFDTNKNRTLNDVFHIGARAPKPQTASAMRLAMRYEEFLISSRSAHGWRHWNIVKDEHQDVDSFFARREELQDWYGVGEKIYRVSRILVPAVMVFRFYQSLAWPDGDDQIQEFTESLIDTSRLPNTHPARVLKDWSREVYENSDQVFAKRETQLMLLFRAFAQSVAGSRIPKQTWAYGQPMTMPFHPKGHDVAVKTVRLALDELDRETATQS